MPSWNLEILEQRIAPGIGAFNKAEIPDIVGDFPEAPHWLANHFLNSVLGGAAFNHGWKQAAIGFLRRTGNAFRFYHEARSLTLSYLTEQGNSNPSVRVYYEALSTWENFVLQFSMALDLFKWMASGQGVFVKNDGSPEQRLFEIANQIKHTGSCLRSGQCTQKDTVPLWLSNTGLCSFANIIVTYDEAASILRELATLADKLQNPSAIMTSLAEQPSIGSGNS